MQHRTVRLSHRDIVFEFALEIGYGRPDVLAHAFPVKAPFWIVTPAAALVNCRHWVRSGARFENVGVANRPKGI